MPSYQHKSFKAQLNIIITNQLMFPKAIYHRAVSIKKGPRVCTITGLRYARGVGQLNHVDTWILTLNLRMNPIHRIILPVFKGKLFTVFHTTLLFSYWCCLRTYIDWNSRGTLIYQKCSARGLSFYSSDFTFNLSQDLKYLLA